MNGNCSLGFWGGPYETNDGQEEEAEGAADYLMASCEDVMMPSKDSISLCFFLKKFS